MVLASMCPTTRQALPFTLETKEGLGKWDKQVRRELALDMWESIIYDTNKEVPMLDMRAR